MSIDGMKDEFDIAVIGGGTAGLVTASGCARLGRKVALIEREALGGDCLWTGCVPTKALVASAKLAHHIRHAEEWGLTSSAVDVQPAAIMQSMRAVQQKVARHDDPEKFRQLGIEVIHGEASFISRCELQIGSQTIRAKDFVIATGSRTAIPPIEGLSDTGFLDHVSFLRQNSFPRSLVIIGGGYIGVEFAQLLRRFGTEVTIVEAAPQLIAREDQDVILAVTTLLRQEGVVVRTGFRVIRVSASSSGKIIEIEGELGERATLEAEEVFVASGRRGNTETLNLERAGVDVSKRYVVVDRYLRTTANGIWACGDVQGAMQFTHSAAFQAVKLVRNILFPGKSAIDFDDVPRALYTDPEVASVGLNEDQARKQHGDARVRVLKIPVEDVDRAATDRTPEGFIKLITNPNGTILGAHAVCSMASTVLQEVVLARKHGLTAGDLARRISPYPSLSDGIQKAAVLHYASLGTGWTGALARGIARISQ